MAVMLAKRRMFWKVRPIPALTMSFGRAALEDAEPDEHAVVPGRPDDGGDEGGDEQAEADQDQDLD